jgi:hypothetical protein
MYSTILAATDLFDTQVGGMIKAILRAVALIVLLIGAAKSISSFTSGTPGKGAKIILGTAIVCSFLFNPAMASQLIEFFSTIVSNVISSGGDIANSGLTPSATTTIPPR